MRKQYEAFFTVYQIAFTPAQKQYRIGLLFTQKYGDLGATYRVGVHTILDSF